MDKNRCCYCDHFAPTLSPWETCARCADFLATTGWEGYPSSPKGGPGRRKFLTDPRVRADRFATVWDAIRAIRTRKGMPS